MSWHDYYRRWAWRGGAWRKYSPHYRVARNWLVLPFFRSAVLTSLTRFSLENSLTKTDLPLDAWTRYANSSEPSAMPHRLWKTVGCGIVESAEWTKKGSWCHGWPFRSLIKPLAEILQRRSHLMWRFHRRGLERTVLDSIEMLKMTVMDWALCMEKYITTKRWDN